MKQTKKTSWQRVTMKKLLPYLKKYWIFIAASLVFAAVASLLMLYVPILIGRAIDQIAGKGRVHFTEIFRILCLMAVVTGAASLSQWLMNLFNNRITYGVVRDLRESAFEKIQKLPLKYLDSNSSGDLVSRVIADADQVGDGLLLGFTQLFSGVVTIVGTLFFMVRIQPQIALVVIGITPLSLFVASFIARHTFDMFQKQSVTRGEQTSLIEEIIGNQKIVQAFGQEEAVKEQFQEINQRLAGFSLRAIFYSSLTNPCTRFVNSLVYTGVGIFGAVAAVNGAITVGQLASFLSYANQYTKPFNEISGVITELQNAVACAGRILELIEETPEPADSPEAVELNKVDGYVDLEQVSFSYDSEKPFLQELVLHAGPGQKIAIVGPTGCGKTTLINLLMRFYEIDGGSVAIDQTDIRSLTRSSLRSSCGMVLQDTWLKQGTILENLRLGRPDASHSEVVQAAKESHAHGFITLLPDGYDTIINEDGGNLSQGQKQLLCITRIMLAPPPILILDEATSSIDTRTEMRIQKAFQKLMNGRTSFIVAHRLSTIREADVILYMRDGRILEQGNHETLLAQNGYYAQLYRSQFEGGIAG